MSFISFNQVGAQASKLFKSVKNSVTEEITGKPVKNSNSGSGSGTTTGPGSSSGSSNSNKDNVAPPVEPEPQCVCTPAVTIMEMGKYKIDYTELSIHILNNGSVLVKDIEKN